MPNQYRIYCAGGGKPRKFVIVDKQDYYRLVLYQWKLSGGGYAYRYANGRFVWLHKEVMRATEAQMVDHRDRDRRNCRRKNLRRCSHAENRYNNGPRKTNTTGYKGVSPHGLGFQAYIQANLTRTRLGYFRHARDAARAYDVAARELHGAFAYQNFRRR